MAGSVDRAARMKELQLLQACKAGASDVVLEVLQEDASLVAVESDGKRRTPLLVSARAGRRDIVELLLRHNDAYAAGGNSSSSEAAAAAAAAASGSLVDVDHQDVDGKTALQLAAFHGDAEVAALLLASGADALLADHRGLTPLHVAAWQGRVECAALLLDSHADGGLDVACCPPCLLHRGRRQEQEQQEQEGSESSSSSSRGACFCRRWDGAQRPGRRRNEQQQASGEEEEGPRQPQRRSRPRRDYWALINAVDERGRTALYMAASYEQAPLVALLLERGASPLLASTDGKRPLNKARASGNKPIMAMLRAAEREPQRVLSLFRARQQGPPPPPPPAPPSASAATGGEEKREAEEEEDIVAGVAHAAAHALADDLFFELVALMAPHWMG